MTFKKNGCFYLLVRGPVLVFLLSCGPFHSLIYENDDIAVKKLDMCV